MACSDICNNPRVGNIGVKFLVTIKDQDCNVVDISTATVKKIYFEDSERNVTSYNASLETDGTDGKMYYLTDTGDLSVSGQWRIQGYVEIDSSKLYSTIEEFVVEDNLS